MYICDYKWRMYVPLTPYVLYPSDNVLWQDI